MLKNPFKRRRIHNHIPKDMQKTIDLLKKCKDKEECLEKAYGLLCSRYYGSHLRTITQGFDLFIDDLSVLWNKKGFLHCTHINYLLEILIVKSGFFETRDIKFRWTLVWDFFPHQYLFVRMGKRKYISVDVWGTAYGIRFGDYAHHFNC